MGKALAEFITVRYEEDHAAAKPVIEKFNIMGFPTLLVLAPDGAELDEVGPREPEEFVEDLARIRRGEGTLPALRAAVKKDPTDTKAALELARSLSMRHADESIELCIRILASAKDLGDEVTAECLFLQGNGEQMRFENKAALALWERVLTEFPKTKSAEHAAVMSTGVLPMLPPERGLAFLAKAIPLVDEKLRRRLEYTRGYLYREAAKAEWLKRGEEAGDEPEQLNNIAWECFLAGWHTEKATAWARKAVKLGGRAPHMLDTLANLLFRQGKVDEAIRLEEEALATAKDPAMRMEFEESLAKWNAVKVLRQERAK